jgi:tRNA dimethylallyltransferase
MPLEKRVALIAGPTASGKSALALEFARERGGIIINADAMQVYRELRILTARPTAEEEALVPHRLYGHISGAESYSAARWLAEALREIEATWEAERLPIIVGGTGLYFRCLEQGIAEVPDIPPSLRAELRARLAQRGSAALHAELASLDSDSARRLKPLDSQRILRSLEVVIVTGKSLGEWQAMTAPPELLKGTVFERVIVEVPRAELHARAEARFERMLATGALEEVRVLPDFDPAQPIMKAIGVRELKAHLAGTMTLAEATQAAKTVTRQYIKRQFTWWRGAGAAKQTAQ